MVTYSFSLETIEYFLLILVRISCFVSVAPFFGMSNTPARVKIGFSAFVSILLFQVLPQPTLDYADVIGYATIVVREGITGLLIGFAASICNSIVLLSGSIIDMDIGLSMATEYDPINNTNSGITGNMYNYFVMLLLLASDMHLYILRAVIDAYELIPIGGQVFEWDALLSGMTKFMTDSMVIGFRIALPVFACSMILNCVLGIMSKVAPQMNMFAVGMQLKVLVGIVILFLTVKLLPYVSDFIFTEMKRMIVSMVKGMY